MRETSASLKRKKKRKKSKEEEKKRENRIEVIASDDNLGDLALSPIGPDTMWRRSKPFLRYFGVLSSF